MNKKSVFDQLAQLSSLSPYTKVLTASLQLDIYPHLSADISAKDLAAKLRQNESNTAYSLEGPTSIGFVVKNDEMLRNSDEAETYFVKGKPEYLGGFIQYYIMNEGSMPFDIVKLVTEGPQPIQQQTNDRLLDSAAMDAMMRQAQEGYRQKELLDTTRSLSEDRTINSILDLGCGTGLLGMSVVKDSENRQGIFVDLTPASIIEESANQMGLSNRIEVINGNLPTDEIGKGYDLILVVFVALLAKENMDVFLKRCYDTLDLGGVMLAISEAVAKDHTLPWDMVMGYLPYYMQGMNMGVLKNEVSESAKRIGSTNCERRIEPLCSGVQDIGILRKQTMNLQRIGETIICLFSLKKLKILSPTSFKIRDEMKLQKGVESHGRDQLDCTGSRKKSSRIQGRKEMDYQ